MFRKWKTRKIFKWIKNKEEKTFVLQERWKMKQQPIVIRDLKVFRNYQ